MALPPRISQGFGDEFEDLFQRLQLSTSLTDGLVEYLKRRDQSASVDSLDISVQDPLDAILKLFQQEIQGVKEENRRIVNAIRAVDDTQQVMVAMVRPLIIASKKKRKKK